MVDQEQLIRLQKDRTEWNIWREEHPKIQVDLRRANLSNADLSGTNLSGADLRDARLFEANLSRANLSRANLSRANLNRANLNRADFSDTDLYGANLSDTHLIRVRLSDASLSDANLSRADLSYADLSRADLSGADLSGADLSGADLSGADLSGADLREASVGWTKFTDLDLHSVKALETIVHRGPSSIGIDTLYRSQGQIPESFLRKAGVPDDFLTYLPSLMNHAIEYYTCFISYSSKDQEFVESLYTHLQAKGVRCWFAPEDLKIGEKIRQRIHESIRLYDKLLLILSEHSVASEWVEFEVETALEKERQEKRTVLFPIRLDSAVKNSPTAWAAHIRNTRNIGNFSQWKDHDPYQTALKRLLRDLQPEQPPQSHTT